MNALRQVLFGLRKGDAVEPDLIRLAKIKRHLLRRGGEDEQVGADVTRQQAAGVVLVDHSRDAGVIAVAAVDYGDAASAHGDHHHASIDQGFDRIQLDDLLREVVQNSAKRIDNPNVRLSANLAGNLPPLRVSPTEMQQVFLNLVNNALDALGPRGGTVEIASRLDGDRVVVDVTDTGQGIPEELLDKIFEPFFTTKPVGKGTGLGLAICYGIIDRLGGRISVKSRPGEGTTFRVEIPVVEAAAAEKRPETGPPPEAGTEPVPGAGEAIFGEPPTTVLLVDDEEAFVDAMAKRLSKRNLSVLKALSGEEALRQLSENPNVDVVILDVKLSGMDGLETLAAIQRAGHLAEVILLSGHTTVEAAIEGIKRGAFDYLMKPCDMALLFGQIEKARAKKRRREQTLLEDRIRDITMRRM